MNIKCFFGFHAYEPTGTLYWQWDCNHDFGHDGLDVIQEYQCNRCGNVYTKIVQHYSECSFDLNQIVRSLRSRGIPNKLDYIKGVI